MAALSAMQALPGVFTLRIPVATMYQDGYDDEANTEDRTEYPAHAWMLNIDRHAQSRRWRLRLGTFFMWLNQHAQRSS